MRMRRGSFEVGLIVALYLVSELSRGLAGGGASVAEAHATSVVRLEKTLHVFHEAAVQHMAAKIPSLPTLLGYAYVSLHLAVTASVLVWVYRRHRTAYPFLRNTLILTNVVAVLGYWLYPTAPPRLARIGIADTVSGATSVNLSSHFVSSFYNPYAAVPSMHIGFSVLAGVAVAALARRPVVRVAALAYPLFVLFMIVATGNHFFFDAAAGATVALTAATVVAARPRLSLRMTPVLAGRTA